MGGDLTKVLPIEGMNVAGRGCVPIGWNESRSEAIGRLVKAIEQSIEAQRRLISTAQKMLG